MSLTAGCVTAVVILVRQLLRRAPKRYSYLLWLVVAFRLVCPFSFNSDISIFNLKMFGFADLMQYQYTVTENAGNTDGINDGDVANMPVEAHGKNQRYWGAGYAQGTTGLAYDTKGQEAADMPVSSDGASVSVDSVGAYVSAGSAGAGATNGGWAKIITFVWLSGGAVMLVYGIISYVILDGKLKKALKIEDNVYRSNRIDTPFVMGLVHPRIYVPCFLDNTSLGYVIEHERCHILRHDYIVKAAAFGLLCVHWFNPLIWAAFILMGKDMEMSCDELVLKRLNSQGADEAAKNQKDYSYALLCCASAGRFPAPGPLCFGDISVKGRIKNVLNYRKPKRVMTAVTVILCMLVLAACSANPKTTAANDSIANDSTISDNNANDNSANNSTTNNSTTNDNSTNNSSTNNSSTNNSTTNNSTTNNSIANDNTANPENTTGNPTTQPENQTDTETSHSEELKESVFNACVKYHMDPQEVWELIDASEKTGDKVSIFTQCKIYGHDELDEWREKMAAYYGDDWEAMYSGVARSPVYQIPVDDATLEVGYGYRQKTNGTIEFHAEDDFAVAKGSEVHAVADGTVQVAGWDDYNGLTVVISQNDGYTTHYCHLGSAYVNVGDTVATGDVIALSGQSGNATEAMLSFAVSYYDEETGMNFVEPVYTESPYVLLDIDYTENEDGTYTYDGNVYKYKVHVPGKSGENRVTLIILTNDTATEFEFVEGGLASAELSTGVPEYVLLGWY